MPRLSALMIRISLIYLALGFTSGGLILANKGVPFLSGIWMLLSTHIELMMIGWLIQFALGVAFWILPRYKGGSRGNVTLALISFGLLNLGILVVIFGELSGSAEILVLSGRSAESVAGILFILHAWGRVRSSGTPKLEQG
jgi:heme/copper-type cytochrome/quinol oxidase subunit 1